MSSIDQDEQTLQTFVAEALSKGKVWGLQGEDGWAVCESLDDEDVYVYPFFSSEAAAKKLCVDEWSHYHPSAVPLQEFIEDWLPGMHDDYVLVGPNWGEDMVGLEVEPENLAELMQLD